MLWPLWVALGIGTALWLGLDATKSPGPVNACTYLSEEEVAGALAVQRTVAERSIITEPANLCNYSVPGGNYQPDLPERVLVLSLHDSESYELDRELFPGEEEIELDGAARAIIGSGEQSLDIAVRDRQVSLFLATGVPAADRRRILLELGTPLIERWLHD